MATPRLRSEYMEKIVPSLKEQFGYKNFMEIPTLKKIVINAGLGKAVLEPKLIDKAVEEVSKIAGQKPVVTKAKKAISNFKLRENMPIGVKVTLRGAKMYEFFDRLKSVALPRVRDFRGISSKGFDREGNYTLGIKDYTIFPEINMDAVQTHFGMNITFVSSAKSADEGRALLTGLGLPFRKSKA